MVSIESQLLAETKWGVGDNNSGTPTNPINEGDPGSGVHLSKSHNVWDNGGVQDAPDDWGNTWE